LMLGSERVDRRRTARHGTACPHVIVTSCSPATDQQNARSVGRRAQSIKPVNEFANKTREGRGDANTRDKHINYTTTTPSTTATTQWRRLVNSTATSQPDSLKSRLLLNRFSSINRKHKITTGCKSSGFTSQRANSV